MYKRIIPHFFRFRRSTSIRVGKYKLSALVVGGNAKPRFVLNRFFAKNKLTLWLIFVIFIMMTYGGQSFCPRKGQINPLVVRRVETKN
jgi:hypothetical protein